MRFIASYRWSWHGAKSRQAGGFATRLSVVKTITDNSDEEPVPRDEITEPCCFRYETLRRRPTTATRAVKPAINSAAAPNTSGSTFESAPVFGN